MFWLIGSNVSEETAASIFRIGDGESSSTEIMVPIYQTVWHHIAEDNNLVNDKALAQVSCPCA
jgi:hypothetical protein